VIETGDAFLDSRRYRGCSISTVPLRLALQPRSLKDRKWPDHSRECGGRSWRHVVVVLHEDGSVLSDDRAHPLYCQSIHALIRYFIRASRGRYSTMRPDSSVHLGFIGQPSSVGFPAFDMRTLGMSAGSSRSIGQTVNAGEHGYRLVLDDFAAGFLSTHHSTRLGDSDSDPCFVDHLSLEFPWAFNRYSVK
jgi:hypothetical protein